MGWGSEDTESMVEKGVMGVGECIVCVCVCMWWWWGGGGDNSEAKMSSL